MSKISMRALLVLGIVATAAGTSWAGTVGPFEFKNTTGQVAYDLETV
jgi:hypothetical protein